MILKGLLVRRLNLSKATKNSRQQHEEEEAQIRALIIKTFPDEACISMDEKRMMDVTLLRLKALQDQESFLLDNERFCMDHGDIVHGLRVRVEQGRQALSVALDKLATIMRTHHYPDDYIKPLQCIARLVKIKKDFHKCLLKQHRLSIKNRYLETAVTELEKKKKETKSYERKAIINRVVNKLSVLQSEIRTIRRTLRQHNLKVQCHEIFVRFGGATAVTFMKWSCDDTHYELAVMEASVTTTAHVSRREYEAVDGQVSDVQDRLKRLEHVEEKREDMVDEILFLEAKLSSTLARSEAIELIVTEIDTGCLNGSDTRVMTKAIAEEEAFAWQELVTEKRRVQTIKAHAISNLKKKLALEKELMEEEVGFQTMLSDLEGKVEGLREKLHHLRFRKHKMESHMEWLAAGGPFKVYHC